MDSTPERIWNVLVENAGELYARRYLGWLETVYVAETMRVQIGLSPVARLARVLLLLQEVGIDVNTDVA